MTIHRVAWIGDLFLIGRLVSFVRFFAVYLSKTGLIVMSLNSNLLSFVFLSCVNITWQENEVCDYTCYNMSTVANGLYLVTWHFRIIVTLFGILSCGVRRVAWCLHFGFWYGIQVIDSSLKVALWKKGFCREVVHLTHGPPLTGSSHVS